jgi:hypothetical protein
MAANLSVITETLFTIFWPFYAVYGEKSMENVSRTCSAHGRNDTDKISVINPESTKPFEHLYVGNRIIFKSVHEYCTGFKWLIVGTSGGYL